jgi:hypothetical protein
MPLLLKILGAKAIGTIMAGLLLLSRSGPGFMPIAIGLERDSLVIETSLKKGFNKGLQDIIMSGSEVAVFYTCALLEKDAKGNVKTAAKKYLYQSIIYCPAENRFHVLFDPDSVIILTELKQAEIAVSSVKMRIVPLALVKEDNQYSVRIHAVLNTIEIEAFEAKQFDLNAFWDFKYPKQKSAWIKGTEFLKQ